MNTIKCLGQFPAAKNCITVRNGGFPTMLTQLVFIYRHSTNMPNGLAATLKYKSLK